MSNDQQTTKPTTAPTTYVLAGGLGTRIRSVLGDVPKLLAPIKGQPYVETLLQWLRSYGIGHVVLGLGFQAEAIIRYLDTNPLQGMTLEYVIEQTPLGTAGALRLARNALRSEPTLVLNGDSLLDVDLEKFLSFHRSMCVRATMACVNVGDASRFGRVITTGKFVDRFAEKDEAFAGPGLINAGAYLLSQSLLDDIASSDARSLEYEVFAKLPGRSIAAFLHRGNFVDFGTPDAYKLANT
jgi:NDP-sugar pyrophosphorylase family protein